MLVSRRGARMPNSAPIRINPPPAIGQYHQIVRACCQVLEHPAAVPLVDSLRIAGCVFAEDEARLLFSAARNSDELAAMVERRIAGLPLEHVLGWADFCGLRIAVDPGVFVPRRRTEFLVHQAVSLARPGAVVVDLCCGSGAVGCAMGAALGQVKLYAVDIDEAAVKCARRNVSEVAGSQTGGSALRGQVYEGDLYEPLPGMLRRRVDVLVANAPYVPTEAIGWLPPEARLHEPRAALDGGLGGLDVQRRVAAGAPRWLAPGGHLLVQTSQRQAALTAGIFADHGLTARVVGSQELDVTVVIGGRPALGEDAGGEDVGDSV